MSNLITEYLEILDATRHISISTKDTYRTELDIFNRFVNKNLLEVDRNDILAFFNSLRDVSGTTVNKKKIIVKAFYNWLEDQEKIQQTPFHKLKFKIEKTRKPMKVLSMEQVKSLLLDWRALAKYNKQTTPRSFRALRAQCIIRVFLTTGIRRKELINLQIQDCDIKERSLAIRHTKTKRDRKVYIDKDTAGWLTIYLKRRTVYARNNNNMFITYEGESLTDDDVDKIVNYRLWLWRIKGKFDGVKKGKGMGAHTFRRTWATYALRNGADLKTIQILLGHSDITTTAQYLFPAEEDIKRIYDKTNILDMIKTPKNFKPKTVYKMRKRKKEVIEDTSAPTFDERLM